jgi:hypothetical protein
VGNISKRYLYRLLYKPLFLSKTGFRAYIDNQAANKGFHLIRKIQTFTPTKETNTMTIKTQATDSIAKIVSSDITNAKTEGKIEARYLQHVSTNGYKATIAGIKDSAAKYLNEKGGFDRSTPEGARLGDRVSKINQLANGTNADGAKPGKSRVQPLSAEKTAEHQSFSSALKARDTKKSDPTPEEKLAITTSVLEKLLNAVGAKTLDTALQAVMGLQPAAAGKKTAKNKKPA